MTDAPDRPRFLGASDIPPPRRGRPPGSKNKPPPPPPEAPPPDEPGGPVPAHRERTHVGLGERLRDYYGHDWIYVPYIGWHNWTGTHWAPDRTDGAEITLLAVEVARRIKVEEIVGVTAKESEAIVAFARRAESKAGNQACVHFAQAILTRPIEQFDRGLYDLNFRNGTVDLRTGEFRPHRREDYITHCCPTDYAPDAPAPIWEGMLRLIMPQTGLPFFFEMALGYSLTSDCREQCMFVLHGNGANGKSTAMGAAMLVAGQLGHEPRFDSFLVQRSGRNNTDDIASWRGKRLLFASEANPGAKLDEAMIKSLTGGERVTARHLYHKQFTFTPTAKIWLACNQLPHIRGTDDGIWRRIRTIPFEVQIPAAERDSRMPDKLAAELPGIAARLVRAAGEWYRLGRLEQPACVALASAEYRSSEDALSRWVDECCDKGSGLCVAISAAYSVYKRWCEESGEHCLAANYFSRNLKKLGIISDRDRTGTKVFNGITVKTIKIVQRNETIDY